MTEFMGNICGEYDAKAGFAPGASSLHSCMTPHGPDTESYEKAVQAEQKPFKTPEHSMAFMFESGYLLKTTTFALDGYLDLEHDYYKVWEKLAEVKYEAK